MVTDCRVLAGLFGNQARMLAVGLIEAVFGRLFVLIILILSQPSRLKCVTLLSEVIAKKLEEVGVKAAWACFTSLHIHCRLLYIFVSIRNRWVTQPLPFEILR